MTEKNIRTNMTQEEIQRRNAECMSTQRIANLFGYTDKYIRNVIHANNIQNWTVAPVNHRNGKPRLLYHPDDIREYLKPRFDLKVFNLLHNKNLLREILRENKILLDTVREIVAELS